MAGSTPIELLTSLPIVDAILDGHAGALGRDAAGYRHHVYRVVNFAAALGGRDPERLEKLAIAGAFHDLGIWTARTFDYLPPSLDLATAYLATHGRDAWAPEIATAILEHHKVSTHAGDGSWIVEPFRRADWVDVTLGVRRFGLDRRFVAAVRDAWPDEGFHWRLVELAGRRLVTHPLSPLPMLRL